MKSSFRKNPAVPHLTREQAARQSRVSRLAFETLRKPGTAVTFLNAHNDALEGRPIDLAIASDDGLIRVEGVIAALARG
ncbi:DUF2384 domain-containing protein [Sphingomonas sp. AP4-R1]|uniref:DUF2384 domain-containing protein n=1 Tax=Sphingomonas sp. AP4-R1 TaxID=2735134 RepID=UPI0014939410|nr:DUF2384 domain-containing protein [Sphingomonas sp. AP4-R1]QJU60132.1 DUF2384 domain-containing protein [Sphingomonas sp. AP4-R1]